MAIQVMAKLKELSPDTDTVVLTGNSTLKTAISALRHGAFDYIKKPCSLVEIESMLNKLTEKRLLAQKCRALQHRVKGLEGVPKLIGDSQAMHRVRTLLGKVAPTESTVLVLGETGTGKELAARAVHEQSSRLEMPFVRDQLRRVARELNRKRIIRTPERKLHRC